jgi:hypothetical protein
MPRFFKQGSPIVLAVYDKKLGGFRQKFSFLMSDGKKLMNGDIIGSHRPENKKT